MWPTFKTPFNVPKHGQKMNYINHFERKYPKKYPNSRLSGNTKFDTLFCITFKTRVKVFFSLEHFPPNVFPRTFFMLWIKREKHGNACGNIDCCLAKLLGPPCFWLPYWSSFSRSDWGQVWSIRFSHKHGWTKRILDTDKTKRTHCGWISRSWTSCHWIAIFIWK